MSDANNMISLTPRPTDAERAAAIRAELAPVLDQVCVLLNKARSDGLNVNFTISFDPYGKQRVMTIDVMRLL